MGRIKVHIENFQAHESVDIDIEKLTMIIGPNDTGKSAVFRAITFPIENEAGDWFIRSGCDNTRVRMEFLGFEGFDDLIWEWQKGKETWLKINGDEPLTKIGRGQKSIMDVLEIHKLAPIDLAGEILNLHFYHQDDKPLLTELNRKRALFDLFSKLAGSERMDVPIKQCRDDLKILSTQITEKETKLSLLRDQLRDAAAKMEVSKDLINKITDPVKKLEQLEQKFCFLDAANIRLKDVGERIIKMRQFLSSVDSVINLLLRIRECSRVSLCLQDYITYRAKAQHGARELEGISTSLLLCQNIRDLTQKSRAMQKYVNSVKSVQHLKLQQQDTCKVLSTVNLLTQKVSNCKVLERFKQAQKNRISLESTMEVDEKINSIMVNILEQRKKFEILCRFKACKELRLQDEKILQSTTVKELQECYDLERQVETCPLCKHVLIHKRT
jgi:hypothetical protein